MKELNLISVVAAHSQSSVGLLDKYLLYHSANLRQKELDDLSVFVNELRKFANDNLIFDKYFVGYTIPQISKEFDLLRIGHNTIVNIELKSNADEERIRKQLIQNKYYLSFLNKEAHFFTFTSRLKKLFTLDQSDQLVEAPLQYLVETLWKQMVSNIKDIDNLFNPSNYLISPFNSTDEFIQGKYFLTVHQEKIRNKVFELFANQSGVLLSIKGKAGTGKTLLTFDIAKELIAQKKRVLLVHCGILNSGHRKLVEWYKWPVVAAKDMNWRNLSAYDVTIIDEAQRIFQWQLQITAETIRKNGKCCIFSYDGLQVLKRDEIKAKMDEQIEFVITEKPFELTTKIRSNKEIADFLNCLFDNRRPKPDHSYPNIELNYFINYPDAVKFIHQKRQENWKAVNYTPSTVTTLPYEAYKVSGEDNAHTVIGQEYDNVIAVIDEHFFYRAGKLSTRNYSARPYYHPTKMLFQIVTRTRLKLCIVVVNNLEIFEHCLAVLNAELENKLLTLTK